MGQFIEIADQTVLPYLINNEITNVQPFSKEEIAIETSDQSFYIYNTITGGSTLFIKGPFNGRIILTGLKEIFHFLHSKECTAQNWVDDVVRQSCDAFFIFEIQKYSISGLNRYAIKEVNRYHIWTFEDTIDDRSVPLLVTSKIPSITSSQCPLPRWIPSDFTCDSCSIHVPTEMPDLKKNTSYHLRTEEVDLFVYFYEDCKHMFVMDLKDSIDEKKSIEKLPMVITFCSRHHPYEKLINVGSDEKGEEIYFFNYEKKLLDIKQDLSKLYVFNLRTFLWEERQLDVSKIRCRDLKVDSFRSTNDTIYFFKEIKYSRRIACYFAFLDIESLTWNEHWVYFDRYGFPYDMDMAGHSFYGFISAGAKNFFLFARKDKEPYLLKWQTVSPQNKELIPSSY